MSLQLKFHFCCLAESFIDAQKSTSVFYSLIGKHVSPLISSALSFCQIQHLSSKSSEIQVTGGQAEPVKLTDD